MIDRIADPAARRAVGLDRGRKGVGTADAGNDTAIAGQIGPLPIGFCADHELTHLVVAADEPARDRTIHEAVGNRKKSDGVRAVPLDFA
jgi:hypothetical protein